MALIAPSPACIYSRRVAAHSCALFKGKKFERVGVIAALIPKLSLSLRRMTETAT